MAAGWTQQFSNGRGQWTWQLAHADEETEAFKSKIFKSTAACANTDPSTNDLGSCSLDSQFFGLPLQLPSLHPKHFYKTSTFMERFLCSLWKFFLLYFALKLMDFHSAERFDSRK